MSSPTAGCLPAGRLHLARLLLGVTATVALIGCNANVPPTPSTEASASPVPGSASAGASDAPSNAPAVGQTDTDWGRIWDEVPEAFPVFPTATRADEAAAGAVSATFALQDAEARTVAAWMQTELERATYRTEALNGPFEDGSFILDLVGAADCRIQVSVAPLGGLTTVTVRYGADCPTP